MRILFLGGIFAVLLAVSFSWILTNDLSPLAEYFLWHPQMQNLWGMLNLPSYILGAIAAGNPHNTNMFVFWTVFFIQWFVSGIIFTAVFKTLFRQFNNA